MKRVDIETVVSPSRTWKSPDGEVDPVPIDKEARIFVLQDVDGGLLGFGNQFIYIDGRRVRIDVDPSQNPPTWFGLDGLGPEGRGYVNAKVEKEGHNYWISYLAPKARR